MPLNLSKRNYDHVFANFLGLFVGYWSLALGLFEMFSPRVAEQPYVQYDFIYLMIGGTVCIILGTLAKYSIPHYEPPTQEDQF